MNDFQLGTACPACGYAGNGIDSQHNKAQRCMYKATDVPLRCEHSADPAELAKWPPERYELDGKAYAPVTKLIPVSYEAEVANPNFKPDEPPSETNTPTIMEPRQREERIIDENATLAAGPLTPPRTIPHVHRTCQVCGTTWPELLKA